MNRTFGRKKDKTWIHTPETLTKSCVSYSVKFSCQLKKSEGQKIPKVELQISIRGIQILDPKSKEIQHNCQLQRISFCADDKTDKHIFTFICKDGEQSKHLCFVFDSERSAEDITLTIGQAFDLAYKKFLESGGKDAEAKKQVAALKQQVSVLQTENLALKKRVAELEETFGKSQVIVHSGNFSWPRRYLKHPARLSLDLSASPTASVFSLSARSPTLPSTSRDSLQTFILPSSQAFNGVPPTDPFDMVPFSLTSEASFSPTNQGLPPSPSSVPTLPPPIPSRAAERGTNKDAFGADPFDPLNSPVNSLPKYTAMQDIQGGGTTRDTMVLLFDPLDSKC
uniref:PTB domain-containing engulfment adapter protein 1 isoform X2 n=1 Tax=Myxine glutinosa TaxID=7769 RepID=UPI00358E4D79